LAFKVGDPHNPNNHPVYIVDQDLGSCILSIDDDIEVGIDKNCTKEKIKKMYIALVCGRCFLTMLHLTLELELGHSLWLLIINS
jgi:hypothetical protein